MPVPSLITDLSTSAGSNSPAGTDSIGTTADDFIRALSAFIAQLRDGSKNIALGSAGAPSQAYTGDSNTGTFSPGADIWGVSTGGTERLRVDASGRITNPSNTQPSFNGRDSANRTTTGDFTTYTELHDSASNFDASTGVFTAPVSGKYLITLIAAGYVSSGSGVADLTVLVNGSGGYSVLAAIPLSTSTSGCGASAIFDLTASNTVKVNLTSVSGTGATIWCRSFCGHLLS
jgi:hypothetical protein